MKGMLHMFCRCTRLENPCREPGIALHVSRLLNLINSSVTLPGPRSKATLRHGNQELEGYLRFESAIRELFLTGAACGDRPQQ